VFAKKFFCRPQRERTRKQLTLRKLGANGY
jgi:hypothetical protein